MKVTDIEGTELKIGDVVYYARKQSYSAGGELLELTITNFTDRGYVSMGKMLAKRPSSQLILKKV